MKEWLRVHPYQALAVGYVLFFALGTGIWLAAGRDLKAALVMAFTWTLFYLLIALTQIRRRRKATASLEDHGQTMVYLRYPDSRPGSLSSIWNQGIATPSAGPSPSPTLSPSSIHFQPALYDTLEPAGRATTIAIQGFSPERRNLTGKDRKYIPDYGLQAMRFTTDDGTIEIAAQPETLDKLLSALGLV